MTTSHYDEISFEILYDHLFLGIEGYWFNWMLIFKLKIENDQIINIEENYACIKL